MALLATLSPVMAPATVAAQNAPIVEIAAGATLLRNRNVFEGNRSGWLLASGWRFAEHLGIGLEVGRNDSESTLDFLTARTETGAAMAGPRVFWAAGPIGTFAQVLAGAIRRNVELSAIGLDSTGTFASTHRAISVGGGIDVPIVDRIGLRASYDLRRVFVAEPYSEHRLQIGAVYSLR